MARKLLDQTWPFLAATRHHPCSTVKPQNLGRPREGAKHNGQPLILHDMCCRFIATPSQIKISDPPRSKHSERVEPFWGDIDMPVSRYRRTANEEQLRPSFRRSYRYIFRLLFLSTNNCDAPIRRPTRILHQKRYWCLLSTGPHAMTLAASALALRPAHCADHAGTYVSLTVS